MAGIEHQSAECEAYCDDGKSNPPHTRGTAKAQHPFSAIANAAAAAAIDNTVERTEPKRPTSRYWASCIKRIYEIDPLTCPKCGEQMKIVAFITDSKQLARAL